MLELFPYRATQVQGLELAFCFNPNFDKRTPQYVSQPTMLEINWNGRGTSSHKLY
jgi:hypothetical protein